MNTHGPHCQLFGRLLALRDAGNLAAMHALLIIADTQEAYLANNDLRMLRLLLEEIRGPSGHADLLSALCVDCHDCPICAALHGVFNSPR